MQDCPACGGELVVLPHGGYSIIECARGCGWWDENHPVEKQVDFSSDDGDRLRAAIKWAEDRAPRCEICGEVETHRTKWGGRKQLARDHSHQTNRQRGLLCARCNTGLGFFRDEPRLLANAIEYLRCYH